MSTTQIAVKPTQMDSGVEKVVGTLRAIGDRIFGDRIFGSFQQPLVVGYYYQGGDYPMPSFSYYYLAEMVKGKLLGFIPRTRKRVLVSMNDPHRNYGSEVGCTVLCRSVKGIVEEEVRRYAQAVNATKVTILDDNDPLVI